MPTPFALVQRNTAVAGLRNAQDELRSAEADAAGASHALRAQFEALDEVPRLSRKNVTGLQSMMIDGVIDPREANVLRNLVREASAAGTETGDQHAAVFQTLVNRATAPEMKRVVNARSTLAAAEANLRAADEEVIRYNEYPHNDRALYDLAMVACLAAQRDRRYFVPCDHRYLPIYRHHYAPPLFIIDQPRWR